MRKQTTYKVNITTPTRTEVNVLPEKVKHSNILLDKEGNNILKIVQNYVNEKNIYKDCFKIKDRRMTYTQFEYLDISKTDVIQAVNSMKDNKPTG